MQNMGINKVIGILRNGGVVILTSESCYGISALASSKSAIERIHTIKQESNNKPVTILVNSLNQLREFGVINDIAIKLSHHFHPGQLNLIINLKDEKFDYLSSDGIAFRIPQHKLLHNIIEILGEPITTTSANIHGQAPIYNQSDLHSLDGSVDYINQDGNLDSQIPPSTVYDTRNGKILRQGSITLEQIHCALAL